MEISDVQVLLFAYFSVVLLIGLSSIFSGASVVRSVIAIVLSALGLLAVMFVGATTAPGQNFVVALFDRVLQLSRTDLTAIGFGVSAALPFIPLLWAKPDIASDKSRSGFSFSFWLVAGLSGVLVTGLGFAAKDLLSPYLPNPGSESGSAGVASLVVEGFAIEDYADTVLIPVRLAVSPAGRLFVSGHLGIAAQEGGVVELVRNANGSVDEILVARMLNRPYGLVATDEELFVSRSGQHTKWTDGRAEQISTGAVTRLVDVDNDGVMDFYDDIVTGLPGAKGPDFLHQNNGLALGSDGSLYITSANHTDAHPESDILEGTILRASGNSYENLEIYASGLRNPFGIAFDSEGRLFATDNDAQTGLLGGNLGDKLLEVSEGAFYGHPYARDNESKVTKPLLRSSFALGGLAYAEQGSLPSPWDDALYMVIYGEGRIVRLDIDESDPDNPVVSMVKLATVPGAVDVAISKSGDMFVGVYPDKVVRISATGASDS